MYTFEDYVEFSYGYDLRGESRQFFVNWLKSNSNVQAVMAVHVLLFQFHF